MIDRFASWYRRVAEKFGFERDWYLIVLAAGIGLVMSGVAMAFMYPLRLVEREAEELSPAMLWWFVAIAPVIGGVLTGIVKYFIPAGGDGPGVTRVMYAIYRRKSRIPWYIAIRKWISSTCTIASGGSAGAEGPIVTIGSAIGSNVGQALRMSPQSTATLLGCAAAAGIASVFNAPFAGVFFCLEVLLRDFSLRTFAPIVIASVISAAFTQAVLGNNAIFGAGETFVFAQFTWPEIPNYLLLGVLCGVLGAVFVRTLYRLEGLFSKLPVHPILRPMTGALLLGGCGVVYLLIKGTHEPRMPEFYGNGYPVIRELIHPSTYFDATSGALRPIAALLIGIIVLGVVKGLATCLTIGSGGAGGMFAPSLLLGACVGGAFGTIVNRLDWFPGADPAPYAYALVGMGAFVAGVIRAPLTAILIVYEITQHYEAILPLMFAAVISTIVGRLVFRESVYSVKLSAMGVRVGSMSDLTILRRLAVADVPLLAPVFVHPHDSAQRLLELTERMSISDFVVTDDADRYIGLVTGADLKEALVFREAIPLLQVNELQRDDLPTVTSEDTLDVVLDRFSEHDVHSLAVLDDSGGGRVAGLITRSRLMKRYLDALEEE